MADLEQEVLARIERQRKLKPRFRDELITMAHGAGMKATQTLVSGLFEPSFANEALSELADAARAEEIGAQWLREFFDRIGADSVKAPAAEMIAWSAAEHELYAALQRSSVPDCAAMTMGEWIFIEDSSSATAAAIARRNAAMVRAAAAGRDNPQDYAEPDDGAFGVLGDAIAATGIDPELQANLGSDQAMAALSPEQQCTLGVAVYKGLSAMPDDLEPQMAAYMLAPQ